MKNPAAAGLYTRPAFAWIARMWWVLLHQAALCCNLARACLTWPTLATSHSDMLLMCNRIYFRVGCSCCQNQCMYVWHGE